MQIRIIVMAASSNIRLPTVRCPWKSVITALRRARISSMMPRAASLQQAERDLLMEGPRPRGPKVHEGKIRDIDACIRVLNIL